MQVAIFHIQIVLQDRAAEAEIGSDVNKVVIRSADFIKPERHDLHQPASSGDRNGVAIEVAFDIDDSEDQFGCDLGARRLMMHALQNCDSFFGILYLSRKPAGHIVQPDLGIEAVGKTIGLVGRSAE